MRVDRLLYFRGHDKFCVYQELVPWWRDRGYTALRIKVMRVLPISFRGHRNQFKRISCVIHVVPLVSLAAWDSNLGPALQHVCERVGGETNDSHG